MHHNTEFIIILVYNFVFVIPKLKIKKTKAVNHPIRYDMIRIPEQFNVESRLVLKCGLAHLNANARDESNANASAQHLNQMQMQMRSS